MDSIKISQLLSNFWVKLNLYDRWRYTSGHRHTFQEYDEKKREVGIEHQTCRDIKKLGQVPVTLPSGMLKRMNTVEVRLIMWITIDESAHKLKMLPLLRFLDIIRHIFYKLRRCYRMGPPINA